MKIAKRFLSMLLSLCLVLGLFPSTAFAAGSDLPFTDVKTADWFYKAVQYAYENGIMNGTSTTTFSPDYTTDRGMIVTVLHRMESTPSASGASFSDVSEGKYYADAVAWAEAHDIVNGYGNGIFGPEDPITREQMATILYRYAEYKGYDTAVEGSLSAFSDADEVSTFAVEGMTWAIGSGLIKGIGDNLLDPQGSATRSQMATILMRFCNEIVPSDEPGNNESKGETYTVTFNLNHGSNGEYSSQIVKARETVSEPSAPSRSGYTFSGWYTKTTGGTKFDFNTEITSDITLYAHWSASSGGGSGGGGSSGSTTPSVTYYTVTFDLNYGETGVYQTKQVAKGGTASAPATPSRSGYTFDGWYTAASGGIRFDFSTAITSDLTLYAHWSASNGAEGDIYYKAPSEDNIASGTIVSDIGSYEAEYVANQLIIRLGDGYGTDKAKSFAASYGASVVGAIEAVSLYQIEFPESKPLPELNSIIADLKANPAVEDAYLDIVLDVGDAVSPYYPPVDNWDIDSDTPKYPRWDTNYPYGNNWGAEAINAPAAWRALIDANGGIGNVPSIKVGIIDSLFNADHDDLDGLTLDSSYIVGPITGDPGSDNASDAAAEATDALSFGRASHGTHVAGTIGADFGDGGINGIAIHPEMHGASIGRAWTGTVTSTWFTFSALLSDLIQDTGCQVINYSQEFNNYDETKAGDHAKKMTDVLSGYLAKKSDFLLVTAAGNHQEREARYSSMFNAITDPDLVSRIIVVGNASTFDGTVSKYDRQAYGDRVDVMAPGTGIYSSVPANANSFDDERVLYQSGSAYAAMTGTSMAAPHVTGIAALVWAADGTLTGPRVKDIIVSTANLPVEGSSLKMVNAAYAVAKALRKEYKAEGACGNQLSWTLDTGWNMEISGSSNMSWGTEYVPWARYNDLIKSVTITDDNVRSVAASAFQDCKSLEEINLGNGIESIGDGAFVRCSALKSIVAFPASLAVVEASAFVDAGVDKLYFLGGTPKAQGAKEGANASFGYLGDPYAVTLYYTADYADEWDPDGDGKWNDYTVKLMGVDVTGSVLDYGTGEPVKGAKVSFAVEGDSKRYAVETGADGKFRIAIPSVPPVRLTATVSAKDYEDETSSKMADSDKLEWSAIFLKRMYPVTVRVIDGERNGLSGIAISGTGLNKPPVTGADGSVTFDLLPGTYTLSASNGDYSDSGTIEVKDGPVSLDLVLGDADSPIWDGTVAAHYAGGTGTQSDPYRIATGSQLALLAKEVNEGNPHKGDFFILTNDIYLNDVSERRDYPFLGAYARKNVAVISADANEWTPIGHLGVSTGTSGWSESGGRFAFSGILDGGGFTIYGLVSPRDWEYDGCGLFGYVDGGTVKALTVADGYVNSNNGSGGIVGLLENGTISDCSYNGYVQGGMYVGGIAGSAQEGSIVKNCRTLGENSAVCGSEIGGIVGLIRDNTQVTGCTNNVYLWGLGLAFGGVVGMAYDGIVSNCFSNGIMFVDTDYKAGEALIGKVIGGQKNCKASANSSSSCKVYNYLKQQFLNGITDIGYNSAFPL